MSIDSDIAFFETVPTLNLLGRAALRILAIGAESRFVQDGEVLFHAGDQADSAYVIREGSLALLPDRAEAREVVAGPGTLLGELAMVTPTTRLATATAREPSTVLRISRGLFLKMLEAYPQSARRLRDAMTARSDNWMRELENVRLRWQARESD
ncbi:MAG TPA: cyclic nucleotide-binding domain-containing protein [Xanthobacteraceae bacterium]|nr:cyclic nucleotide-binding domain-containing protein [Xanthobacteraceae bacterium]